MVLSTGAEIANTGKKCYYSRRFTSRQEVVFSKILHGNLKPVMILKGRNNYVKYWEDQGFFLDFAEQASFVFSQKSKSFRLRLLDYPVLAVLTHRAVLGT